jgi:protein-tyrosine phosphatase
MSSPLSGARDGRAIIVGVIDLHIHILPGLDDGPASEDAALAMARAAVGLGTRAVATTAHVDAGFGLRAADIAAAREALAARLRAEGIRLNLLAGGEIAAERLPLLDDEALSPLTLGGGGTLLLECPFAPVGAAMEPMVDDLRRRGFGVLLAHPERSPSFQRDPGRLARLVDLGASAQVTAGSLAGLFGSLVTSTACTMLEAGLVHVIASDAHDTLRRTPDLRVCAEDLTQRYGDVEDQLAWMTEAAPAAILDGRPLSDRPPLPQPQARGLRARIRRAWSAR